MFQLNEKIRGQYKQTCLSEYTLPENVSSVRIDYENGELKVFINSQPVLEKNLSSKLISPIGFVKDSSEVVFVYRDDSLRTISIQESELTIEPNKAKIWSYPVRIIQQKD